MLLVCGFAAETLQALVPSRSMELSDYMENAVGVAAGAAAYWLAVRLVQQFGVRHRPAEVSVMVAAKAESP